MSRSGLGDLLRQLSEQVTVSVYVDDISMSSTSAPLLQQAYESLIGGVADAGFILNDVKSQPPVDVLTIFNCELAHDSTKVKDERVEEFFSLQRSAESVLGFERYVASVQKGNA